MRPTLALIVALLLAGPAHAQTRPVGARPLTDKQAAAKVKRSNWEPRRANADENRHNLTSAQLKTFRRKSNMPYKWFSTS
jgi:DNA polymerase III delta subunit